MKLAFELPLRYFDEFAQEEDFHYILLDYALHHKKYRERYTSLNDNKDLWLDNSFNELGHSLPIPDIIKGIELVHPTHVVAYEKNEPHQNLIAIEKTKEEILKRNLPVKLIGTWKGTKWELEVMKHIVDLIALPYDIDRTFVFKLYPPTMFHFFGFRSLKELYLYTPLSLDTSVPFRAAQIGISLRDRQRRPKHLPAYDPNMLLSKEQLNLVRDNIESIRETTTDLQSSSTDLYQGV